MESTETSPDELIARLAELGRKDREAILAQLSHEQRGKIDQALRERADAEAAENERQQRIDRQFLGYSPWLASLVEGCEDAQPTGLTKTAAEAVWKVHSASVASRDPAVRSGWAGVFDRLSDIFGPARKGAI